MIKDNIWYGDIWWDLQKIIYRIEYNLETKMISYSSIKNDSKFVPIGDVQAKFREDILEAVKKEMPKKFTRFQRILYNLRAINNND